MGKRKLFIGIDKGYNWQVFDEKYRDVEREDLPGCPDELMGLFVSLSIQ
ncbi:MAG: hypothetical protein RBR53_03050 [Desulforegulaceae bacterium]|nr:hypothetical protein [Desulforegulaceae bacterium]